jgi:fermentation-respiration switch protein FrsA (DUF1100 family)
VVLDCRFEVMDLRRMRLPLLLVPLLGAGCVDSLFYRPGPRELSSGAGSGVADVYFPAQDGTLLHGWWMPAQGKCRGTVVYCHGRSGDIADCRRWVEWMPRRGLQVLLFDYRGYGRSEGRPTRSGTVEDAVAAVDYALRWDPERTVIYGHSLGGAVAIAAAARQQAVRAVLAESTFPTYRSVAAAQVPGLGWLLRWFVSAGEDPVDALPMLPPRPLLVVHGTEDRMVPFELGVELFERAVEPKSFHPVEGNGHRTPWARHGRQFEDVVLAFFDAAIAGQASPQ